MKIKEIARYSYQRSQKCPLLVARISAGFPSPADDYIEKQLDLNELLVKNPAATFFVRVEGDSMIEAGIHSGDTLIVDRSLNVANNAVAIVRLNGELTVKRIRKATSRIWLVSENKAFKPIEVTDGMDFEVWGVVVHAIRSF